MDAKEKILAKSYLLHTNPHDFLGIFENNTIVQFSPNKKEHSIMLFNEEEKMELIDPSGIFTLSLENPIMHKDYQVIHSDGTCGFDPYEFLESCTLDAKEDLKESIQADLHKQFGAHHRIINGVEGVQFSVYAPNATNVYLRCDLGRWREKVYPMRRVSNQGVYELFMPGCSENMYYKYLMVTKDGLKHLKSDPYARRYELRPKTASVVHKEKSFVWDDEIYIQNRKKQTLSRPVNIYEMHINSWCQQTEFPNYKEMAKEVTEYIKEMGYTHVELLPIKEHPLDESWGYQVVGYFSPTSRYGDYEDFKYFVNYLHSNDIGVILDFVPAHFPDDESFLANFDGSSLYESNDPKIKYHPKWTTMMFDLSCNYVQSFLLSCAVFWIENMHVDGIRLDACSSILYYQKDKEGKHQSLNINGGTEKLEGFAFLRTLNTYLEKYYPDVLRIAEDESFFGKTTKEIDDGGLGFTMKWNIGWAADLFSYLSLSDKEKCKSMDLLMHSYKEVFNEKYLLVLSHDHVSAGKKSLLNKFSADMEEKYSYLRLLYSVAITHPGKKLFFMGHEVGQKEEFHHSNSWRKQPSMCDRSSMHKCYTKDMNRLYLEEKALHEIDFDEKGFSWIDYRVEDVPIVSFIRKSAKETVLVIHNFSKKDVKRHLVSIPYVKTVKVIMDTDLTIYGGKREKKTRISIEPNLNGVYLDLTKLSTVICKVVIDDKRFNF